MNPTNKAPSLLEGLDIPDKSAGKNKKPSSNARKDVAAAAASRTVSRDWTPKQKKIAAFALAGAAVAALAFGAFALVQMRPLELPKTYEEGKLAMESAKFKSMDEVRQAQYRTEMDRLQRAKMESMKPEDRREFFRDDSNREVMMQIREQQFDEMARKMARGEKVEFPFGGPGGPGRGGPGGPWGPGGPGNNASANASTSAATLASFQPRPGDEPPSPAPRTNENRREWGPPGNNQGGPNNPANNPAGPNAPGNTNNPANQSGTPGNPAANPAGGNPAGGNPAGGNPASGNPGGSAPGSSAPAAGAPAAGGGGGGGGGRRGNPTRRIANRIQNGNAQSNGLRFEAMKKMMANAPRSGEGQNPGIRIMFTSGSAELNELAFTTMAPIVKQLTDQPELSLRIWGLVDPKTDGMKLRSTALRDSFAIKLFGTGAKGEQLTKEQLEQQMIVAYNELLATKAAAENKPAPALVGPNSEVQAPAVAVMEQALVESAPNPTEHLIALAQQRQDAIKKYLVEKREFNPIRVRTVGVAPQFMENDRPSAVLQVAR